MKTVRRILAIIMAVALVATVFCTVPASAKTGDSNYSSYNEPENSGDYAYWNGSKVVKSSSTSTNEVKWMQAALNNCIKNEGLKADYIDVDGSFGPATKKATEKFQKAAKLTADGSFGPATIKKMKSVLGDGKKNSLSSNITVKYNLVWPVSTADKKIGSVSSPFGPRKAPTTGASTNHRGIDIAVPSGTSVYSAADGVVVKTGSSNARGKYVMIYHKSLGITTLYQHLSKNNVVKENQNVTAGQKIAVSGNTGVGSGAHLHFGVILGKATNPDMDQPSYDKAIDPLGSNISYRNYK